MFSDLKELFYLIYTILIRGGWVIFLIMLVWMFYRLYMDYINERWYNKQKWLFLKIISPQENEKSPLAFEYVFNQLHAVHSTRSWPEIYLEGQFQIWFTWEITSIGGVIGNYVRIAERHRDTLEAAIYSQFPEAEITEADDYFEHLPPYDPDSSDYDIFAFSMILKKPDSYPIRTYYDFEHSSTDTFVDPATGLWEALGKLNEYEMFVVQYIFQPQDDKWKAAGYELVQKLKGVPGAGKPKPGFLSNILGFIGSIIIPILDAITSIFGAAPTVEPAQKKDEPPSMMLHLSEGEKNVIASVERNLSKLGYATKIRCLYLAPKEKFNAGPAYTAVIGSFKALGATDLNSLKPDTDNWPKVRYYFFKQWEKPIVDFRVKWRKRRFMKMIRTRWFFHGQPPSILNTEEIATLLHFPQSTVTVPQIEKIPIAKVPPPPDLPIAP